jgi:hypothetical protein
MFVLNVFEHIVRNDGFSFRGGRDCPSTRKVHIREFIVGEASSWAPSPTVSISLD